MSILLVTHNLGLVAGMTDRVAVAYAGNIVEVGATRDMLAAPRHPYTQGLLRSVPRPDRPPPERLSAIPGAPPDPASVPAWCPFQPRCPHSVPRCLESMPALVPVERPSHLARCFVLPPFDGSPT
jgi:oligopeptide/dipeptide ABC transporter ATP-binding protein